MGAGWLELFLDWAGPCLETRDGFGGLTKKELWYNSHCLGPTWTVGKCAGSVSVEARCSEVKEAAGSQDWADAQGQRKLLRNTRLINATDGASYKQRSQICVSGRQNSIDR